MTDTTRAGILTRAHMDRLAISLIAIADAPSDETLAAAPLIEAWAPVISLGRPCLMGPVHGHPAFRDGEHHETAPILFIDPDAGYARSADQWYRLGDSVFEADPSLVAYMRAKPTALLSLSDPVDYSASVDAYRTKIEGLVRSSLDD